jgi:hypothetical protein
MKGGEKMTVNWSNVVALGLLVFAAAILVQSHEAISAYLATIQEIGNGSGDIEVMGLLAFGTVLLLIVSVVKIIVESNRKD